MPESHLHLVPDAQPVTLYPEKAALLTQYDAELRTLEDQIRTLEEHRTRLHALRALVRATPGDVLVTLLRGTQQQE